MNVRLFFFPTCNNTLSCIQSNQRASVSTYLIMCWILQHIFSLCRLHVGCRWCAGAFLHVDTSVKKNVLGRETGWGNIHLNEYTKRTRHTLAQRNTPKHRQEICGTLACSYHKNDEWSPHNPGKQSKTTTTLVANTLGRDGDERNEKETWATQGCVCVCGHWFTVKPTWLTIVTEALFKLV